jgi:DNA processing protein
MRSSVVAALTTHLIPDVEALPIAAWRSIKRLPDSEILNFARTRLPGQDLKSIQARLERIDDYESELGRLSEAGIVFVTEFCPGYPQTWLTVLGDKAPPYLFVAGNSDLLNQSAVGIVGSRRADHVALSFAANVAKSTVNLGHSVISGGAKGIDDMAMRTAIEAGGNAIGILADSLDRAISKWNLDSGRVCLATPFTPNIGFQVANAMARNKLIYAGSVGTVVVASDFESGGTWAGATDALRQSYCPVLVRPDGSPGTAGLIQRGGVALSAPDGLAPSLQSVRLVQERLL